MENIQLLLGGFSILFTFSNVGVATVGAVLGLIVGAIPGTGSLAGIALLLPLIYEFNPITAIITPDALYYSNMYDGVSSTVLLNIPGDSPIICMATDGYPMAAKRKRPGRAPLTVNMTSFIGGTIGIIILTLTGPASANVGLKPGPSETTILLLIATISIGRLVGENPIKGVVIIMLGILLANMGMDTLSGSPCYDFGSMYLLGGIPFIPFIIGTVGFPQVISPATGRGTDVKVNHDMKLTIKGSLLTKYDFKRLLPPAIRSGLTGTFVGVLPEAGTTTGVFMGYAVQKKLKSEEELGTSAIEGIAAAEVANNATTAGASAPLLALGIPGSGTGAVLLGGLMMWGLNPGPLLLTNESEFTWGLIVPLFLPNIFTLIVSTGVTPFLIEMLSMPVRFMIPIITTVCVAGPYSSSYSMYGATVMLLSGVLGYTLTKSGFPTALILLSFVLAKLLESNMHKVFMTSGDSLDIFLTRSITCMPMLIFLASTFAPVIKAVIRKARSKARWLCHKIS